VIRVLIVSESSLLGEALHATLSREPDLSTVFLPTATDLDGSVRQWQPQVALVDVDGGVGLDAVKPVAAALPGCAVVVLTERQTPAMVRGALGCQARGVVSTRVAQAELAELVREVSGGGRVIDPAVALATLAAADNPLKRQELEVLRLAAQGVPTREMARILFLSEGTIRNRLSAAVRKTGSRNRLEAVRRAQELGWL
jgi:two-component system, NarL family, response regulator DesR